MKSINRYLIIFSIFCSFLNGAVFTNTTIDEKKVVKELNEKIAYFEDLKHNMEKKLKILEKNLDHNLNKVLNLSAKLKEINKKIYAIRLKRDDRIKVIKKIEDSLKFVNKKDISKEYKEALKYFSKGDVKKASKALNVKGLNDDLIRLNRFKRELANRWLLKANISLYQQNDKLAIYAFRKSIKIIETFSNTYSYGSFLQSQKFYTKAKEFYQKAYKLYGTSYEKAVVQNSLADIYVLNNNFKKAEKLFINSVNIFKKLLIMNEDKYIDDAALVLNNLGNLYYQTNKLQKAKKLYNQVYGIYDDLNFKNPQKYRSQKAMALNNLGNLYKLLGKKNSAFKAYKEALDIRNELASEDFAKKFDTTQVMNNLGNLYYENKQIKSAENLYKKSYIIRKRLAEVNPSIFNSELAIAANNLANLYKDSAEYKKAEKLYLEALKIYGKLIKRDKMVYEVVLGITLNNLAKLYDESHQNVKAMKCYKKVLKLRERLAKKNPKAYRIDLAKTKLSYGFFLKGDKGILIIKEAIKIFEDYDHLPIANELLNTANKMLMQMK